MVGIVFTHPRELEPCDFEVNSIASRIGYIVSSNDSYTVTLNMENSPNTRHYHVELLFFTMLDEEELHGVIRSILPQWSFGRVAFTTNNKSNGKIYPPIQG